MVKVAKKEKDEANENERPPNDNANTQVCANTNENNHFTLFDDFECGNHMAIDEDDEIVGEECKVKLNTFVRPKVAMPLFDEKSFQ